MDTWLFAQTGSPCSVILESYSHRVANNEKAMRISQEWDKATVDRCNV